MNFEELEQKINNSRLELKSDIEKYVAENANLKIGDVVTYYTTSDNSYYVITQIGFRMMYGVVYYANKLIKSTGEMSFQSMHSDIGVPETALIKSILKVKGKEISRIEESKYFNTKLKISVNI
jgi:hypothetical protein